MSLPLTNYFDILKTCSMFIPFPLTQLYCVCVKNTHKHTLKIINYNFLFFLVFISFSKLFCHVLYCENLWHYHYRLLTKINEWIITKYTKTTTTHTKKKPLENAVLTRVSTEHILPTLWSVIMVHVFMCHLAYLNQRVK